MFIVRNLLPHLQAISKLGWDLPTPIQEKAIPLALQGKDILARARTGSGKTAAYAIAVIQKLLHLKQVRYIQRCISKNLQYNGVIPRNVTRALSFIYRPLDLL